MGLLSRAATIEDIDEKGNTLASLPDTESDASSIESVLSRYTRGSGPFHGLVFHSPLADTENGSFFPQLKNSISTIGIALKLKPAAYLVVFPKHLKGNLVAHRLEKSLKIRLLLAFESSAAQNTMQSAVQEAMLKIRPYLEP